MVVRRSPGVPVQILALRDELVGRAFDDPDEWWPEHPGVVGGRDRIAGGTWCASSLTGGTTALLLNRPEKPFADPGAASRGVLPLLALRHGTGWPDEAALAGMASFTLLLVHADVATGWTFDGVDLAERDLAAGTAMFTSGGAEDGRAARHLPAFTDSDFPLGWSRLVTAAAPGAKPDSLLVRHSYGDKVFATVFGQLIEAAPGRLWLSETRTPAETSSWRERIWPSP